MADYLLAKNMEEEIRELLLELRETELAAKQLVRKYEILDCSIPEMEVIGAFLLRCGLSWMFCELCAKKLDAGGQIAWAQFAQAIANSTPQIPLMVQRALFTGSTLQAQADQLARVHHFDEIEPQQAELRLRRRQAQQTRYKNQKRELLTQLEMFRSQELEQEEERVVQLLLNMFPHDEEISDLSRDVHERKAVQLLERRLQDHQPAPWERADIPLLDDSEKEQLDIIVTAMKKVWKKNPKNSILPHDFAIALMMWDYAEASLGFLNEKSTSQKIFWTRLEALLMARQFVNLLSEIDQYEHRTSAQTEDPDATFALLYLKAHALWGLGHRFAALEILENIVAHRPHYRSAMTLLRLWKGGAA